MIGEAQPRTYTPQDILAIAESQPFQQWCQHDYADGAGHYCRLGWIAHQTGHQPEPHSLSTSTRSHLQTLGLDLNIIPRVAHTNDALDREPRQAFDDSLAVLTQLLRQEPTS
jgi:hypothetical protein